MKAKRLKAQPTVQTRLDLQQETISNLDEILRQMRFMYDNPEIHRIVGHALKREFDKCFYQFDRQQKRRKKELDLDLEIESDVSNDLERETIQENQNV